MIEKAPNPAESAPHPAEEAPSGQQIEIFGETGHEDRIDVHRLEPGAFQAAVDRIGAANNLDLSSGVPSPASPDKASQSSDVITTTVRRQFLVGAATAALAIATYNGIGAVGDRVRDAFKSENTGALAMERDAAIDRKAREAITSLNIDAAGQVRNDTGNPVKLNQDKDGRIPIIVNSYRGSDGEIKVRRPVSDSTETPEPPKEVPGKNPQP